MCMCAITTAVVVARQPERFEQKIRGISLVASLLLLLLLLVLGTDESIQTRGGRIRRPAASRPWTGRVHDGWCWVCMRTLVRKCGCRTQEHCRIVHVLNCRFLRMLYWLTITRHLFTINNDVGRCVCTVPVCSCSCQFLIQGKHTVVRSIKLSVSLLKLEVGWIGPTSFHSCVFGHTTV